MCWEGVESQYRVWGEAVYRGVVLIAASNSVLILL